MVAEIAYSSRAIDLHLKKERYALAGVNEYIVICLRPLELHWFDLSNKTTITSNNESIFASITFPGLWIHADGLLRADHEIVMDTLHKGLRTDEHAAFVAALEQARRQ